MVRVLHILNNLGSGGAESFVMNVYRNIDRSKVQFDFLVRSKENGVMLKEIEGMGGKVTILPGFPKQVFANYKALKRYLKEHAKEYKAIHVHANSLVYVKPLALGKKYGIEKRIIHSHNTRSAAGFLHRMNINRIDKWVTDRFACSNMAGDFMFPKKKFTFIPNGIELDKFRFSQEDREKIRAKLEIGDTTTLIGHVGRFTHQKNHEKLLDIFVEYHKLNPSSKLMLVGDGEEKAKIHNLVSQNGIKDHVIFAGAVNNVNEYLSAMDVFCLPSYYEGLAIVLIEAQAASLPCIASSSTPPESNCGNVVYKNLEESPSSWASSIYKMIENGRHESDKEKLGRFDIRSVARYLEAFYLGGMK